MTIIIATFLTLFTILAWKRLDLATLLIIATTPLYLIRFNIISIPFTVLEAMILIAFTLWIFIYKSINFKNLFKKNNTTSYPYKWEIISVLFISWIAIISAGISNESLGVWKAYFFEPLLLFILIINLFSSVSGRKKIIWSLATSALIVSIFAIYQKFTGHFISNPFWAIEETRRVVSFFGYPNAVGLFLAPLTLLFSGYLISILKDKGWQEKLFLIITIFLSLLAIIFAKSEGALVGLIVAGFIFSLFINKKVRIGAIILATITVIIIASYSPLRQFTLEKITLNDLSGQIRRQQWIETKKMLSNNLFLQGAGLSNYQKMVAPYHQEGIFVKNNDPNWLEKIRNSADYRKQMWQPTEIYMYPHNIFLNFWSELGIFGVLLFLWIIAKFLWQSALLFNKEKNNPERFIALGLFGFMLVLLIHGLVDVPYFKNDLSVLFWVIIALLGGLSLKQNIKIK